MSRGAVATADDSARSLTGVGFRALGTVRLETVHGSADVVAYVARYGDAWAFPDPTDPSVLLRVVSVLQSGRLVETRIPITTELDDSELPTDDDAVDAAAQGLVMNPEELGRRAVRRMERMPWVDAFLQWIDLQVVKARYPDRPLLGLHRQLVDVDDAISLWIAHKGLLRRVEGMDDDVVDHTQPQVLAAALRRATFLEQDLDGPLVAYADLAADVLRNLLLAAPALAALWNGLQWWIAGSVVGFCAASALAVEAVLPVPRWRPAIVLLLPMSFFAGYWTIGWQGVLGLMVYCIAIVLLRNAFFTTWIGEIIQRLQPTGPEHAPMPIDELLARYGS